MSDSPAPKNYVPYEASHRLRKLLLVTVVVSDGQADSILEIVKRNEAALCWACRGQGTAPKDLLLSNNVTKKDVVFAVVREDCWPELKHTLEERFSLSKIAKGIAYAIPLSSVAGVSIYKMLSNTRLFEKPINPKEKKGGTK